MDDIVIYNAYVKYKPEIGECIKSYIMVQWTGMRIIDNKFNIIGNQYYPNDTFTWYYLGALNSMNWYISYFNKLYNLNNLNEAPRAISEENIFLSQCIFQTTYIILCTTGNNNLIMKYEFDLGMNLKHPPAVFSTLTGSTGSYYCLQTGDGHIIVNGWVNGHELYVLDHTGAVLSHAPKISDYTYQMSAIKKEIILIANDFDGYSLTEINTGIIQQAIYSGRVDGHRYTSTSSLQEGGGYLFAIGGGRYSNNERKGLVEIGEVNPLDLSVTIHKSIGTLGERGCLILTIKEVETGVIFIGGRSECKVCTWNYMKDAQPLCYDNPDKDYDIYDFLNICT